MNSSSCNTFFRTELFEYIERYPKIHLKNRPISKFYTNAKIPSNSYIHITSVWIERYCNLLNNFLKIVKE